jgi:hypothetical protein
MRRARQAFLFALGLLAVSCVTGPAEYFVGVVKDAADIETYIEVQNNITVITFDGQSFDKAGPLRLFVAPGVHKLVVYYRAEQSTYSAQGTLMSRTTWTSAVHTLEVESTEGSKYLVYDADDRSDFFVPVTVPIRGDSLSRGNRSLSRGINPTSSFTLVGGEFVVFDHDGYLREFAYASKKQRDICKLDNAKVLKSKVIGETAVVVYESGDVVTYSLVDGTRHSAFKAGGEVEAAELAGTDVYLALKTGGIVRFDASGGQLARWEAEAGVGEITKRGRFVTASRKGGVTVIDVESGQSEEFFAAGAVRQARVDPAGERLVVLYATGLFDVRDVGALGIPLLPGEYIPVGIFRPTSFDFSDDGEWFYLTSPMNYWTMRAEFLAYRLGTEPKRKVSVGPGYMYSNLHLMFIGNEACKLAFDPESGDIGLLGNLSTLPIPSLLLFPGNPEYLPQRN